MNWEVARSKNRVIENILKEIEFIKIERLNNDRIEMLVSDRYDAKSIEELDLFFDNKLETDLNIKNLRVCRFGFEEEITDILGEVVEGDFIFVCSTLTRSIF